MEHCNREKVQALIKDLKNVITDEERVTQCPQELSKHGKDFSYHKSVSPNLVIYPKSTKEIQKIVELSNAYSIPIVPFGSGSSVEGQIIPLKGGVTLNFSLMNQILDFNKKDKTITVQPGITKNQLNNFLKKHNLFYSIDPGADATIGGMVSTNASGANTVKYGVTRDQVLGMQVVVGSGEIIATGSNALKSSSGYPLSNLFVGSEGTLGILTVVTLRLHSIPEHFVSFRIAFTSLLETVDFSIKIKELGLSLGKLELVDRNTIKAINEYKNKDFLEADTLFIELSGPQELIEIEKDILIESLHWYEPLFYEYSSDYLTQKEIWKARYDAALAISSLNFGKKLMPTDVCVPISALPEAIGFTRKLLEEEGFEASILGHIGDGNFHAVLGVDLENETEITKLISINEKIVKKALELEGTCTGEHGIGIGKIDYLPLEHGVSIKFMREIKRVFDPKGVLNPGKLFHN